MREIKFRLWNLKNKYMFSNDNEELLLNIDGSSLWGHKIHYYDGTDLLEIDDFEIMQYTGMKDVKGVEIYEGDILQSEHYFKYKVVFKGDCWRCESLKNSGFKNRFIGRDLKVIGNIYENQELLEVEQ